MLTNTDIRKAMTIRLDDALPPSPEFQPGIRRDNSFEAGPSKRADGHIGDKG